MKEANTTAAATRSAGAPKMEPAEAMREMVDQGTMEAKESAERMSAATAEASSVVQSASSTAARGVLDCNAKLIEFARANSNAAFDYASELLGVRSPSEILEVSTAHVRKQFEVLSEQTKEFSALSQKVMLQAAEPFKAGAATALRGPFAWGAAA